MKIDNSSEVLSALRSHIASRSEGTRSSIAREIDANTGPVRISVNELRQRMGREIRSLDLQLPTSRRGARIAFIESVLTWDFGEELLGDPQFGFLVRDIEESIEADPTTVEALDQLLLQLRAG